MAASGEIENPFPVDSPFLRVSECPPTLNLAGESAALDGYLLLEQPRVVRLVLVRAKFQSQPRRGSATLARSRPSVSNLPILHFAARPARQ